MNKQKHNSYSKKNTLFAIFISSSISLLSACGGLSQDTTVGWSAQQLYDAGKADLQAAGYTSAANYYNKLLSRFPYDKLAQQALLDLAYVYYKASEPEKAIEKLDEFIKTYPQHPYIDYALFMRGVVEYEKNVNVFDKVMPKNLSQTDPESLKKAFNTFAVLVEKYPQSKYAEDARYRMVFIKNLLAEHYLETANYYLRHGSYIAAAARAKQILEEYQQTPSAPYALAIMHRAYKELGEQTLADDTMRLLQHNFADKLNDKEIQELINGDISKQRGFISTVRAKPKIN
ncbi:MAG: outer membrane protein assembly factor BamD [Cardiobacteriaceae bacterium]|nr:outer membrane protein assembly factor BamD [Cardiobacteriaceae bacterium]